MNQDRHAVTLSRADYDAVIFDMDGVVTRTAKVHAAAWKALFDEYRERSRGDWEPFDPDVDYRRYVDGKPRYDGVKSFLESRNIALPYGSPEDDPQKETVCGLGNRKNAFFHDRLRKQGVEIYEPGVRLVKELNSAQFKTAVVSSSKNCAAVLEAAGISDLFRARVDGVESEKLGLKGKPDPDIFVEAARRLGAEPRRSVVVEDAIAGVQAGKNGNFGCVIGVDRTGHGKDLRENGADVVVAGLSEVDISASGETSPPSALEAMEEIKEEAQQKEAAVFLDYDGTLTPIVDSPDQAVLSDPMRDRVIQLAEVCTVAVISGRDLKDVQKMVGIDNIFYAGSHGFDIAGPKGKEAEFQQGKGFLPALDEAEEKLRGRLDKIQGALLERKKFSIAVHYRKVKDQEAGRVEEAVDEVLGQLPRLRKSYGKKVYELQPKIDWHKGKALLWVLDELNLNRPDVLPFYLGDDTTDEDAFKAIKDRGIGIVVMEKPRPTEARYSLKNPEEAGKFLEALKKGIEH
jgi:alpha,alpha-trehalase